MSRETSAWLNTNQLIGFTAERGTAWHYRASEQGAESNHYPAEIPVEDVRRRLLGWEPKSIPLVVMDAESGQTYSDPTRQVIVRPDTGDVFGIFKQGYKIHGYDDWCIKNVETITDSSANADHLFVAGAGLLRKGAQMWVQFEFRGTKNVGNIGYRPFLTAFTSLDGSLASGYTRGVQLVVCDNTLSANISEAKATGAIIKRKHTLNSLNNISDVREALEIVFEADDSFLKEIEVLNNTPVSDVEWAAFLNAHKPIPEEKGIGRTKAINQQDALNGLYFSDPMCAPWKGTAFGVVQTVNTFAHHMSIVQDRTGGRSNVNALRSITVDRNGQSDVDKLDRMTLATLNSVFKDKRRKQIAFV